MRIYKFYRLKLNFEINSKNFKLNHIFYWNLVEMSNFSLIFSRILFIFKNFILTLTFDDFND